MKKKLTPLNNSENYVVLIEFELKLLEFARCDNIQFNNEKSRNLKKKKNVIIIRNFKCLIKKLF